MDFPYSRAELFLRNLKDTLADTCNSGMLSHIIENRKTGSLHFYIALLKGFRKDIMPDIVPAYNEFISTNNWDTIEQARKSGYKKAKQIACKLKTMNSSWPSYSGEYRERINGVICRTSNYELRITNYERRMTNDE